jgi:hypothetical protein
MAAAVSPYFTRVFHGFGLPAPGVRTPAGNGLTRDADAAKPRPDLPGPGRRLDRDPHPVLTPLPVGPEGISRARPDRLPPTRQPRCHHARSVVPRSSERWKGNTARVPSGWPAATPHACAPYGGPAVASSLRRSSAPGPADTQAPSQSSASRPRLLRSCWRPTQTPRRAAGARANRAGIAIGPLPGPDLPDLDLIEANAPSAPAATTCNRQHLTNDRGQAGQRSKWAGPPLGGCHRHLREVDNQP